MFCPEPLFITLEGFLIIIGIGNIPPKKRRPRNSPVTIYVIEKGMVKNTGLND
jgi:hypothetical protein